MKHCGAVLKTDLMKKMHPFLSKPPYYRSGGLLLSVSGGLDSMVLLDLFWRMAHVHRSPISVVHVHHHTGPFAEQACTLVKTFCRERDVPMTIHHFHWRQKDNFEYAAATYRKKVLEEARVEGGWIVLAHHLQDQAETFLQTLVRGAGTTTPLGMGLQKNWRLRPFLGQDRALLVKHAGQAELPHVLDPTNHDTHFFRNALRHRVMPLLRSFHGHFEERLAGWLEDQGKLREDLLLEAATLFEAHYRDGLLRRTVFKEARPWLWDFVLVHFWDAARLPKLRRKEQARLRAWLENGACGSFDHAGLRFHCDLDGLTLQVFPEKKDRGGRFGQELEWRPWRFFIEPGSSGQAGNLFPGRAFRLKPRQSAPKQVKDYYRRVRLPHRFREALPVVETTNLTYHFYHLMGLEKAGHLEIRFTAGPELKSHFRNLNPAEFLTEAWTRPRQVPGPKRE